MTKKKIGLHGGITIPQTNWNLKGLREEDIAIFTIGYCDIQVGLGDTWLQMHSWKAKGKILYIQRPTRSIDEDMEEEAEKEGNKEEEGNDAKTREDVNMAPYCKEFEDLFASEQPSTGGPDIRESTNQPKNLTRSRSCKARGKELQDRVKRVT
ncbi:hypothetical protein PVK06_036053 [Gossypium arboreum]|uniref:Uncharacterized protein n=1 Tax=Gossypium arboreum TaxID=29729 RepID=A0ABR0NKV4_GOSAR|nr:hypothetical protein PVK06_036053 [Gossypium arboreum]